MTTTTHTDTIQDVLDRCKPGEWETAAQRIKLGTMMAPITETITVVAAASVNLVTASVAGLAAQEILRLRVTGVGTGALGPRVVTDSAGTPAAPGATGPGIATLSADGATLTFEGTVTDIIVTWKPMPYVAMTLTHP